jgi:hypothetical protein
MLKILSLGAGVQSSALALLYARGEFTPMPDAAIFADTQAEPAHVYAWLDWLETLLPYPVHRVTKGSLETDTLTANNKAPFYVRKAGQNAEGMLWRQCTQDYKVAPLRRKVRAMLEDRGEDRCAMYIGISLDESLRMRRSNVKYIENHYPLVDAGYSRHTCLQWMDERGYPMPAKSACYFCPYTDDSRWRDMKLNQPVEFERAVKFDAAIRNGLKGVDGEAYVHRSLVPLAEVDLRNAADYGQLDAFNNECEGMCGV